MNDVSTIAPVKVSTLPFVIEGHAHDAVVERLAYALIEDLKSLCDVYKEVGESNFRKYAQLGIRATVSHEVHEPYKGTYVSVGLGEGWLNFGFLATPVVEFLRKHFVGKSVLPPTSSTAEYDTLTRIVNASTTKFITPEGAFLFERTYTWFVCRRVD